MKHLIKLLFIVCLTFYGCNGSTPSTTPPQIDFSELELRALVFNGNEFTMDDMKPHMFRKQFTEFQNGSLIHGFALGIRDNLDYFPTVEAIVDDEDMVDTTIEINENTVDAAIGIIEAKHKITIINRSVENPDISYKYIFSVWFRPTEGIDVSG